MVSFYALAYSLLVIVFGSGFLVGITVSRLRRGSRRRIRGKTAQDLVVSGTVPLWSVIAHELYFMEQPVNTADLVHRLSYHFADGEISSTVVSHYQVFDFRFTDPDKKFVIELASDVQPIVARYAYLDDEAFYHKLDEWMGAEAIAEELDPDRAEPSSAEQQKMFIHNTLKKAEMLKGGF